MKTNTIQCMRMIMMKEDNKFITTEEDIKYFKKHRCTKLTFSLFRHRWWRIWITIKDFKILVERIFFTLKHGYTPVAEFNTDVYLIDMLTEIMINYRYHRQGDFPMFDEDDSICFHNKGFWSGKKEELDEMHEHNNKIFDKIIYYLIRSNENYWVHIHLESYDDAYNLSREYMDKALNLIVKNFDTFWD